MFTSHPARTTLRIWAEPLPPKGWSCRIPSSRGEGLPRFRADPSGWRKASYHIRSPRGCAYLRERIHELNYHYHVLDAPLVEDAEYDSLFRELEGLEGEFSDLRTPDSPTQRVGAPPSEQFEQVTHRAPLLSLANAFNDADLTAFDARVKRFLGMPSMAYGRLERALVRGWRSRGPTNAGLVRAPQGTGRRREITPKCARVKEPRRLAQRSERA